MQYQGHTISNPFPQYEYPPFNSFRGSFYSGSSSDWWHICSFFLSRQGSSQICLNMTVLFFHSPPRDGTNTPNRQPFASFASLLTRSFPATSHASNSSIQSGPGIQTTRFRVVPCRATNTFAAVAISMVTAVIFATVELTWELWAATGPKKGVIDLCSATFVG